VGSYPTLSPLPVRFDEMRQAHIGGLSLWPDPGIAPSRFVTERPALWSPDFPQVLRTGAAHLRPSTSLSVGRGDIRISDNSISVPGFYGEPRGSSRTSVPNAVGAGLHTLDKAR